jgi:hypothetical protein
VGTHASEKRIKINFSTSDNNIGALSAIKSNTNEVCPLEKGTTKTTYILCDEYHLVLNPFQLRYGGVHSAVASHLIL